MFFPIHYSCLHLEKLVMGTYQSFLEGSDFYIFAFDTLSKLAIIGSYCKYRSIFRKLIISQDACIQKRVAIVFLWMFERVGISALKLHPLHIYILCIYLFFATIS